SSHALAHSCSASLFCSSPATTAISTLSLHDALPIYTIHGLELDIDQKTVWFKLIGDFNAYNILGVYASAMLLNEKSDEVLTILSDRKSTRLNSSHVKISYAVFCLKKKHTEYKRHSQ